MLRTKSLTNAKEKNRGHNSTRKACTSYFVPPQNNKEFGTGTVQSTSRPLMMLPLAY